MDLTKIEDYNLVPSKPLSKDQQDGVRFLLGNPKTILAFQTGLGKTLVLCTALAHIQRVRDDVRGVIVCPINALSAFERELKDLGYKNRDIGWLCTQRMDYSIDTNKVFIFTYPSLSNYASFLLELRSKYKLVGILDEAHKLQAEESEQKNILNEIKPCFNMVWLSTATPLLNDLLGLFNVISFLYPNFFDIRLPNGRVQKGKTAFINRYMNFVLKDIYIKGGKKKKVRDFLGVKNVEELKERIKPVCMMRQKSYDLKFGYFYEDLTEQELSIYEKVSAGIMTDEERSFSGRMHDLQRVVDNSYENELISDYESTKEKILFNVLGQVMIKGYPIIIYCDYRDTVNRLEYILGVNKDKLNFNKIYQITGDVDKKGRDYIKDNITARDIIIITSAGSESINLQKSNCILFYDIPYSVGTALQAIGRITRVDTLHAKQYVMVIYTKGTIDEYKYMLFLDHAKVIQSVLGSDANLPVGNLQEIDRKSMDALKTKLIWHYKDGNKKLLRRNKKLLEKNLSCFKTYEFQMEVADYYINLSPWGIEPTGTKRIDALMPDKVAYDRFKFEPEFLPIFKNKYIDVLKSDSGKKILNVLVDNAVNKNKSIIFVDDYGVGKIIKDYIVENAKVD